MLLVSCKHLLAASLFAKALTRLHVSTVTGMVGVGFEILVTYVESA